MLDHADAHSAERRAAWTARARGIVGDWRARYRPLLQSDAVPIRPERICHELSRHLPDDAIVMADTGHSGMWMGGMYDLSSPRQSYIRSAGHLGWAFPAGLGAKCAAPERPVFVFTGDAGFWYHLTEIETAVRCGINTVTLVNNNSSGNQGAPGFDRAYGGRQTEQGRELWTYSDVDFATIAEAMGALGLRVDNPADIPGALETAFAAGRPAVIDVVSDIEAFAPLAVIAGAAEG